jgi:hypothetical protein
MMILDILFKLDFIDCIGLVLIFDINDGGDDDIDMAGGDDDIDMAERR